VTPFLIKEDNDGHQQGKTFSRYSARDKSDQLMCSSMRNSSQGIKEMYSAECFVVVKNLTVPISSYAFLMNFTFCQLISWQQNVGHIQTWRVQVTSQSGVVENVATSIDVFIIEFRNGEIRLRKLVEQTEKRKMVNSHWFGKRQSWVILKYSITITSIWIRWRKRNQDSC
jgi:hypothetical protein